MDTHQISCFVEAQCSLGEGPVWDDTRNGLWWVDIVEKQVYFADATGQFVRQWTMPELVGFVLPRSDGRLWAGFESGLHIVHLPDEGEPSYERIDKIDHDPPNVRFNDAAFDGNGNIYASTMDLNNEQPLGKVLYYKVNPDGRPESAVVVASDFVIANGPATADSQTLFMIESSGHPGRAKGIWASSIRPDGTLESERHLVEWPYDGSPDGGTIDSAGNVWVGHYGGDTIRQFSPAGKLLQAIQLPVINPTKVAIQEEGKLYVTSAREGATDEQIAQYPLTGSVLQVQLP
ncbi:SMP-30/gluconolactonase/LRE family protein [Spirosoma soli]|uniref:SMP-30/gluconolactonase/LRE family protein n=1 Tax=Spirosoma soli TaxID=1770529 RepID=A0ABW5MAQ1_9BACT